MKSVQLFTWLLFVLQCTGKCTKESTLPSGIYRVIGAEGEASLTSGPDLVDELTQVSMTYWSGTTIPVQEWIVSEESSTFSLVNVALRNNVISLVEPEGILRLWRLVPVRQGVTYQIKDARTGRCLTRLGVTVYQEGTSCDSQAQSQHWKFLFLKDI